MTARMEIKHLCDRKLERVMEVAKDEIRSKMISGALDIPDDMDPNDCLKMSEILVCSALMDVFSEYRQNFTREQAEELNNLERF